MSKIVFLSAPAYGHVNPTLPVVQELVQRRRISPTRRANRRDLLRLPCRTDELPAWNAVDDWVIITNLR